MVPRTSASTTSEVLRDLAGHSVVEVDPLAEAGVITDVPAST